MFTRIARNVQSAYRTTGQKVGASVASPCRQQLQVAMFVAGVSLLALGLSGGDQAAQDGLITYNDDRITQSVNAILTYLEGTFGALVMVAAGLGAILSSAFGQYRAALGCLVVAIGSFILRSILSTFFNDSGIQES